MATLQSIGYNSGQVDPSIAKAAGYKMREDNPFDYIPSDHINKIGKDLPNMYSTVRDDVSRLFWRWQMIGDNIFDTAMNAQNTAVNTYGNMVQSPYLDYMNPTPTT